jgi:hypothetical protein
MLRPAWAGRLAYRGADTGTVRSCYKTGPCLSFWGSPAVHSTSDTRRPTVKFSQPRERATPTGSAPESENIHYKAAQKSFQAARRPPGSAVSGRLVGTADGDCRKDFSQPLRRPGDGLSLTDTNTRLERTLVGVVAQVSRANSSSCGGLRRPLTSIGVLTATAGRLNSGRYY